ncbi:MAG: PIN domain-containing protein [Actinomycetota bacterium]
MAVGWIVDKSAAVRSNEPDVAAGLSRLGEPLFICDVGMLEQLFSARSAASYDLLHQTLRANFSSIESPADLLTRAIALQRDLAHHHGMWHRIPVPDLLIAETALHHNLGVVHVDADFEKIAKVRPLETVSL